METSPLPDFLTDMNAVLKDKNVTWLGNGGPPNYEVVDKLYFKGKCRLQYPLVHQNNPEHQLNCANNRYLF